ncbi:MAG: YicC/YloC family endoribonuclease [Leptospirillia bacterium]
MSLSSMTGYGRAHDDTGVSVEVRTVNHRHLDISLRLPRMWAELEPVVRTRIGSLLRRGRVEVGVRLELPSSEGKFSFDSGQAARYLEWAQSLSADADSSRVDLAGLLALPGVVSQHEDVPKADAVREQLIERVDEACRKVVRMREREGEVLAREISGRMDAIAQGLERLNARRPEAVAGMQRRLTERVRILCADTAMDEARLAQEVAILVDRTDVTEELTRLASHIEQFRSAMESSGEVGRTLDFLLVEMNREVNTVGSKCQDTDMSAEVVVLKGELEKVREQVQNVE